MEDKNTTRNEIQRYISLRMGLGTTQFTYRSLTDAELIQAVNELRSWNTKSPFYMKFIGEQGDSCEPSEANSSY